MWLGTISYTIYLFHDQLSWFFKPLVRRVPGAEVELILRFVVFGVTIPIMAAIFRLVERPFLKPPAAGSRLAPIYARLSRAIGL